MPRVARGSNLAFHVDFHAQFVADGFFAEDKRSLKSHSSEDQTIFLVTRPRTVHVFCEQPFADRRIILQSETEELPSFLQIARDPFNVGHNDLANDRR
jgi:hypothetical protein